MAFRYQPEWAKNFKKEQPKDQITIVKPMAAMMQQPYYTGKGADGKTQPSNPTMVGLTALHENESVIPSDLVNKLGGHKGVKQMVLDRLAKTSQEQNDLKKIEKMPMVKGFQGGTIELTPAEKAQIEESRSGDGIGEMPEGTPVTASTSEANAVRTRQMELNEKRKSFGEDGMGLSTSTPNNETSDVAYNQDGTVRTQEQSNEMVNNAASNQISDPAGTYDIKQQDPADVVTMSFDKDQTNANNLLSKKLGRKLTLQEANQLKSMTPAALEQRLINEGLVSWGQPASGSATTTPPMAGQTSVPSVAGQTEFNRQYNAAQNKLGNQQAVTRMALANRISTTPGLTEGAKNTALLEQDIASGSQQSQMAANVADKAAAYVNQERAYNDAQSRTRMSDYLAAGDIDNFAAEFQKVNGVPIDTTKMRSTQNQAMFRSGMADLNTYLTQFPKADISDPSVISTMRTIWDSVGTGGEMPQDWASKMLENTRQSQDPYYQALNSISDTTARSIWGDKLIDDYVDPVSGKTGYSGFTASLARDMAKGFVKIDKATGNISIDDSSVIFSLGQGSSDRVSIVTTPDGAAIDVKTLKEGGTISVDGKTYIVGTKDDQGWIVTSADGQGVINDKGEFTSYTRENTSGIQYSTDGNALYNGKTVNLTIDGSKYPIKKVDGKDYAIVNGGQIPVTINPDSGEAEAKGAAMAGGKLYFDGKEVKTGGPTGGTLTFPADADISSVNIIATDSKGVPYVVTTDGMIPKKYDAQAFTEDVRSGNYDLSLILKNTSISPDQVFDAYMSGLSAGDASVSDITKLIDSNSQKAKDYVMSKASSGNGTFYNIPSIKKYMDSIATSSKLVYNSKNGTWGANVTERANIPGGIVTLNGKTYSASAPGARSFAGTDSDDYKNYYYPVILTALDGSGLFAVSYVAR